MIIYDQLRISDDGQKLYINAHVNGAEEFQDTTIEELYICLGSQVYETLTIDPESNGYIYKKDYEDVKEINEVIEINDESPISSFSKDLFFVYVKCANVPGGSCCYTMVGNYVLGVVFDESLLYQKVMQFTKSMADDCKIPVGFTDFILLWNAFKAAVETEHFVPAIKFYNMLFDETNGHQTPKPCGCNG
mgnify:CR=1 FL=1